jgi:uncharacterized peroxidase-related enzyme
MRLPILYQKLRPLQKLQTFFIRRMMGFIPGPILLLSYRKGFFGHSFSRLIHQVLRKAEHWTLAELELMGAFLSSCNSCQMCLSDHRAVASQAMDPALAEAVLNDYHTAPIDKRMRSTLTFLEKLALHPETVTSTDLQAMRENGLSPEAITEAAEVCMIFASMNRIVDAFGFEIGPDPVKAGQFLLKNGYKVACLRG